MEPPEAAPDLVGRTSARLLAAGIDRGDRLAALHLLAILDASTDAAGRIKRPLDDLAGEFELEPISVLRSLDHLQRVGAIERDGGAVILLGANPAGLGGMQLADFLDDVRSSFDGDVVSIASAPRRSPWLVRSGAALVAAAAAVAVFTFAPTQPAVEQPRFASASTTTTEAEAPAEASAEIPLATTPDLAGSNTTQLVPEVDITPDTDIVAAATCPTGQPVAELIDDVLQITNPTTASIVISGITVGATTLRAPITLAPGETVTRTIFTAAAASPIATIDAWDWAESPVARSCPS